MGKIYSRILRPVRTFNIENRAEKIISLEKPISAPQYPSVKKQKELVNKLYPDFLESQKKKNLELDKYLKNVYVTSKDPKIEPADENTALSRPLPQFRSHGPKFELGFYESETCPEGKCSLRQALDFMSKHSLNQTAYTAEHIACEYKLDKQVVGNILKYFKIPKVMGISEKNQVLQIIDKDSI